MVRFWALPLFLLLLACTHPKPTEVLAHIDDMTVTVGDLQSILKREQENYDPKSLSSSKPFLKIKQRILSETIDRKLLLREAERHGMQVSQDELDAEVRKFKGRYTELAFQKMLQERRVDYEDWVNLRKKNLLVTKFLKEGGVLQAEITEAMVSQYYQDHSEEFKVPESVRVRQIVTDTKEKAEAILRRLRNGENFAKLAREVSMSPDRKQGGDLGFIPRGSFPREFEVCFTMNPGEISPIIPSLYGFHLFKVLDQAPARTLALEEVKDKITLELTQNAHEQGAQELLKNLRQQAKITVDEKILERMKI